MSQPDIWVSTTLPCSPGQQYDGITVVENNTNGVCVVSVRATEALNYRLASLGDTGSLDVSDALVPPRKRMVRSLG